MLGLRSLATGLPVSFLMNPRKALADDPAPTCTGPQYFIMSTSGGGDPLNANVPGTYMPQYTDVLHSADPAMAPVQMTIGGTQWTAATPWSTVPPNILARTSFVHLMTNTPVHPQESNVLTLMGAVNKSDMLPSVLASALGPCLKTIQTTPLSVGAGGPSEDLAVAGVPLPTIPPTALKATLTNTPGPLTDLQPLRDQTLNSLYSLYRDTANTAQKAYIDSLVTSQQQARGIRQDYLAKLADLEDDSPASQIRAAIALIQMGVSPVVAIHLPFGGDNHHDPGFTQETAETIASIQTLFDPTNGLFALLAAAGLSDQVSYFNLNVFGRTLVPNGAPQLGGRNHNQNHQVSLAIGKPFKGSVIGGIQPVDKDYGALPIDSVTGAGTASGDIAPVDTLASFGKTVLTAAGIDSGTVEALVPSGKVIKGALA